MQSRRTLTLTLSLLKGRGEPSVAPGSESPIREPRKVRSRSPLPARSGERIKVRGFPTTYLRLRKLTCETRLPNCKLEEKPEFERPSTAKEAQPQRTQR